jgi:hypothetical protein
VCCLLFPRLLPRVAAPCKPLTSDHVSWLVLTKSRMNTLHTRKHEESPERKLEQPVWCPTLHVASPTLKDNTAFPPYALTPFPTHHITTKLYPSTRGVIPYPHAQIPSDKKTQSQRQKSVRPAQTDIGLRPPCLPHLA